MNDESLAVHRISSKTEIGWKRGERVFYFRGKFLNKNGFNLVLTL